VSGERELSDAASPGTAARPAWKRAVSCWLAFHLAAVALYPASILVPDRGLLATIRDTFFERYMEALYMVQGHRFFAPEPGPGMLVEYEVERADGSRLREVFPRREIRPRLLYHRHFMLSERVQDVDDRHGWYWMYARHLAQAEGGVRVTLTRVVHLLATPDDILSGKQLEDEEFYVREPLGSWTLAELLAAAPPPPPSPSPSPVEADDPRRLQVDAAPEVQP
jgi:hypothetical protein